MSSVSPNAPQGKAVRTVRGADLRTGMTIQAITELSYEWATLDERRLKFLQNYFGGSKAVIAHVGGDKVVALQELKASDHLQSIVDIPATLKVARVVEGLGQFMEKQGLLEFKVLDPTGTDTASEPSPKSPVAPAPGSTQPSPAPKSAAASGAM